MELSRQMCLLDFEIFSKITTKELCHQNWNKPDAKQQSPNVLTLIEKFNQTSYWVATEIVKCISSKARLNVLKRILEIADSLKKLNNFHSFLAIVSGLNLGCVSRLSKTWKVLASRQERVVPNCLFVGKKMIDVAETNILSIPADDRTGIRSS